MAKPRVVVIGSTGMLGAITLDVFAKSSEFEVIATHRSSAQASSLTKAYPEVEFRTLDAETATISEVEAAISGADWAINAIGIIKPYIHDDNAQEVETAVRVNALFPHALAKAAEKTGVKVIQVATDCVYSGIKGSYVESDVHDATDVYGKTKSLGEAYLPAAFHIRCSIIGPELKSHLSLLDWFLSQSKNASLNGYTNHQWNGVTTLHFARLCQGIIRQNIMLPHVQHIVPGNLITKANLLRSFAKEFNRSDITVADVEAPKVIDRTLATEDEALNLSIWQSAGYDSPPTVEQMVEELAQYNFPKKAGL